MIYHHRNITVFIIAVSICGKTAPLRTPDHVSGIYHNNFQNKYIEKAKQLPAEFLILKRSFSFSL